MIRFYALNPDAEFEEFTERVNLAESAVVLTTLAEQGSVGTSSLVVDDPLGDWDINGHRFVYIIEDSAPFDMMWWGYAADRTIERAAPFVETARKWTVTLTDINTLLGRRIMVGSDCNRPAETDVERIQWLVGTSEQSFIDDTSLLDTLAPVAMDKADYRYQYATQIYEDCSQASGKNWFLYPVFDGLVWRVGFWYGFGESTDFSADIRISNDLDDIDDVVTFPPGMATKLTRDPSRVFSGTSIPYDGGVAYAQNLSTITAFANRDTSAPMVNVKTNGKASARALRYLNTINTEEDVIETSLILPTSQVNDVMPGMRIEAKFAHLPGYADFSWMRVLARTVTFLTPAEYGIDLTLSAQPSIPTPYPIPGDVVDGYLCTLPGYRVPLAAGDGDHQNGIMHASTFGGNTGNSLDDFGQYIEVYRGTTYGVYTYGVIHGPEAAPLYIWLGNLSTYQGMLGDDEPGFGQTPALTELTGTMVIGGSYISDPSPIELECIMYELPWTSHNFYDSELYTVVTYISGPDPRFVGLITCPDPTYTVPS